MNDKVKITEETPEAPPPAATEAKETKEAKAEAWAVCSFSEAVHVSA